MAIASHWTAPVTNTSVFAVFQLYRNYDGNNSTFGDISIPTDHDGDVDLFSAYASLKSNDINKATVVLINKDPSQVVTSSVKFLNYDINGSAQIYQFDQASPNVISRLPDEFGTNFVLPPYSATLIEFTTIPEPCFYLLFIICNLLFIKWRNFNSKN